MSGPPYVCPECGARSWHPKDAERRYCARCGEDEAIRELRRAAARLAPERVRRVCRVCPDCATRAGGVWPPGHRASWACHGLCDACGRSDAPTCDVEDYDWPHGRPEGWDGSGRD